MAPTDKPAASIVAIATGSSHTCALTSGGGVKCWGSDAGELGDGTTIAASVPVDVAGLATGVRAIAASEEHTCALTDGGGVGCWGSNEYGQLGNGSTDDSIKPVDVSGLAIGVSEIAAGASHACALTSAGGVKCWGSNDGGELGDGMTIDSAIPVDVAGLASGVKAIAAGGSHTCAITSTGGVTCWGPYDRDLPVDVPGPPGGVIAIAVAPYHACALTAAGGVKCWGSNHYGELGDGTTIDSAIPVDVAGLTSGVKAITAGLGRTCAVTSTGGVKCWGSGDGGLLGDGLAKDSRVPVDVAGLATGVKVIAAGENHTCALTSDGGVSCWGSNEYGQLGDDKVAESGVPVDVDLASRGPTHDASGAIEHAAGPKDVVLRYDAGPDRTVGPEGESFQPGPEFTLYGDGTIVFRDETAKAAPTKGPIVRASPFAMARLTEVQVQSLLQFALGEGGLGFAHGQHDTGGEGCSGGSWTYTLRVGGVDKRVESAGCGDTFELLAGHLRSVARSSTTEVWMPGSYWGSLLKASSLVKLGALPKVPTTAVPWPWPDIAPATFGWHEDPDLESEGRRVMTADEAAALGLSDGGGVVQRIYLLGPDGATVYAFSLWPRFPDEPS